jgi:predicted metal-binding membrane protein
MLLMFAAGFASLAWMVVLALLMFYEVRGARSAAVVRASGALLIWLALLTSISGVVPGWAVA